ncbi:hypothetical protein ABEB36_010469 [Hypothenemus hampei]|uniref:Uncharacterized protein n=1 Tax=Hypothenemus hampei TaxID=57062 RepID=A0ABD1EJU8_HYPHA
MAATPTFSKEELIRFNDCIKVCLEDSRCLVCLQKYLEFLKKPMLLNTVKLWELVNTTNSWNEMEIRDLIEAIDKFSDNPLLSISECQKKIDYTKGECCRILEEARILPGFRDYLRKKHYKGGTC